MEELGRLPGRWKLPGGWRLPGRQARSAEALTEDILKRQRRDAWGVTGTGKQESSGRVATRHQEAGGGERA